MAASGRKRSDTLPTQSTTHDNQQTDWVADTAARAVSLFRFLTLQIFRPNENKRKEKHCTARRSTSNDTVREQLFGYPSESSACLWSRFRIDLTSCPTGTATGTGVEWPMVNTRGTAGRHQEEMAAQKKGKGGIWCCHNNVS